MSRFNSTNTDYSSYVRDAQGNILAIYTASGEGSDLSALDLKLSERELYGSSRLGSDVSELRVDSLDAATPAQGTLSYYRGLRRYELVNHLGNLLAVISDRKIALPLGGSSLIAHYEPDVLTATDYYPFGMRMPGRQYGNGPVFAGDDYDSTSLVNGYSLPADLQLSARPDRHPEEYVAATSIELLPGFSSSEGDSYQLYIADETYAGSGNQPPPGSADGKSGYRFGFNGKENDSEVKGEGRFIDYGDRMYSPALGRFFSVDPYTKKFPWLTPNQYASNSPIWAIDIDGLEADKKTDPANQPVHPVQTIADGYGDYIKRTYSVNLIHSKMTAKQIFNEVSTNFSRFTVGVSYFERVKGEGNATVGDEWAIAGGPNYHSTTVSEIKRNFPNSGDRLLGTQKDFVDEKAGAYHWGDIHTGVTVKSISKINDGGIQSYSFTFSTWQGHVEAGEITFSVIQIGSGANAYMSFNITSNSRSSNFFTDKAYRFLGGQTEQTKHWTTFLNNLLKATGSAPATPSLTTEKSETPIKTEYPPVLKQADSN